MPAFLAPLLGAAATGLGYLGSAAASPVGQAAIAGFAPSIVNKLTGWLGGGQQQAQNPDAALMQQYRQQLSQPVDLQQQIQQMLNQHQQNTLPGIREMLTGLGGLNSNALGLMEGTANSNLLTNLGALSEQANQSRLGQIGGYLGGQQQLGLQGQQLAQQGNIANRENMLRGMGLMNQYDIGQQEQANRRADIASRLQMALAGQAMNPRFNTAHYGAKPPAIFPIATGLFNTFANQGMGSVFPQNRG